MSSRMQARAIRLKGFKKPIIRARPIDGFRLGIGRGYMMPDGRLDFMLPIIKGRMKGD